MTSPESNAAPTYVVLGATGGIGCTLCRRLARQGARLVIAARNLEKLESLAAETRAHAFPLDATDFEQVETLLRKAAGIHGRVDGVANCVGSLLLKPAHQTSEAEWQAVLATNLGSAFAAVRAAGSAMSADGGSVVLVSSAAATVGLAFHEAVAAAKAGIEGMTRAAAATYAPRRLQFNAVAPGLVRTPLTARLTSSEGTMKTSVAMHPLGRIGEPEDIASAIAWLLAPDQSWVTGQVIGVDGGLARVKLAK